jgi:small subunit ribosomal protein S4
MIANSFLKKYKDIVKRLIATKTEQGAKEKKQVLEKLQRLGLLSGVAELDTILDLNVKDILDRRLQSVLFRQGLARSMKQARQFITHRHITIGDKEINSPSYLISLEEETSLGFKGKSALADAEHPERAVIEKKAAESEEKSAEKDEKEEEKKEEKVAKKKPVKKVLPDDDTGNDIEVAEVPVEEVKVETAEEPAVEEVKKETKEKVAEEEKKEETPETEGSE